MDNYAKVENLLKNYNMIKINIENTKDEIEYVSQDITLQGISYDTIKVDTNENSSSTEDTALSIMDKVEKLKNKIKKLELLLEIIHRSLNELEERERVVLVEKYINAKDWWQVSGKVFIGERQCRNIRRDAINKMIAGIYGVDYTEPISNLQCGKPIDNPTVDTIDTLLYHDLNSSE